MSKSHGTKEFWLAGFRAEAEAISATINQDDVLDLSVPSCPGWTVKDLVLHLGQLYGWVAGHVGRGVTTLPERPPRGESSDQPIDGSVLVSWWSAQYAAVLDQLEAVDPELPAWNWAPQPKKAIFWHRRMAHETAIHRWDAQMATGMAAPIDAELASDALTEVLDTWLAAGKRHRQDSQQGVVALQATDVDETWYARLTRDGIALLDTDTLLDDNDRHERATATGTASDLVLAVYERIPFKVLQLSGEVGLLDGLRTG
jgi:uncharacterized protein (TIGR03083 family)